MIPRTGVHRTRLSTPATATAAQFAADGWTTWLVDGGDGRTKTELLAAIAEAGDFPEWFGGNWDALVDQLRDAAPPEGPGVCLVIDRSDLLGAGLAVLSDIVGDLVDEGARLALVLRGRRPPFRSVP